MITADVIIIGTGVIGTATAFELAKRGYKTLSIDRNTVSGQGSTAGSCAIIRMHYSTFDGTAFAWEGYHYWRDWAEYLGLPASETLAQFKQCGCLVMKTPENDFMGKHLENSRALDIPVEEWSPEEITARLDRHKRRLDLVGDPTARRVDELVPDDTGMVVDAKIPRGAITQPNTQKIGHHHHAQIPGQRPRSGLQSNCKKNIKKIII